MNAECEREQHAMLAGTPPGDHTGACGDCSSFLATERYLTPPTDLVARTLARLQPMLLARAANRRTIFWRVALAGAFSLPIIIGLNAAIVWMTYSAFARLAAPELATAVASLLGMSLLFALSVAYGSLPLLASWGVQLRERTT